MTLAFCLNRVCAFEKKSNFFRNNQFVGYKNCFGRIAFYLKNTYVAFKHIFNCFPIVLIMIILPFRLQKNSALKTIMII